MLVALIVRIKLYLRELKSTLEIESLKMHKSPKVYDLYTTNSKQLQPLNFCRIKLSVYIAAKTGNIYIF